MPISLPLPLGGPAPAEVLLTRSPLARVVAQVRFSSILRIDTKAGVAIFQDRIRGDYPLLDEIKSQQVQIELGVAGPAVRSTPNTIWRFSDAARTVQLSLTTDTATLEALTYEGRSRFLERWTELLTRIEEEFTPGLALRIGLRYVNRVDDDALLERLPDLLNSSLVGMAQPDLRKYLLRALSEALMEVEEGRLLLRWGMLPAMATIDPGLLVPLDGPSWILDIDVFSEDQRPFAAQELSRLSRNLSERAYAMFRYAVKELGLASFGALTP